MKIINLTLNDDELIILRGLKGEAIKNFKGYELFSDLAMWHETLVFRTGKKGFCIENQFKPVPFLKMKVKKISQFCLFQIGLKKFGCLLG